MSEVIPIPAHIPQVKDMVITPEVTKAQLTEETILAQNTSTTRNESKLTLPPHTEEDFPRTQSKESRRNLVIELLENSRVIALKNISILKKFIPLYKLLLENAQKTARVELKKIFDVVLVVDLDKLTALLFHKQLLFLEEINYRALQIDFDFDETGMLYHIYEGFYEIALILAREKLCYGDAELPFDQAIELEEEAHRLFLCQVSELEILNSTILELDLDEMERVNLDMLYGAFREYAHVDPNELLSEEDFGSLAEDEVLQIEEAVTDVLQSFFDAA